MSSTDHKINYNHIDLVIKQPQNAIYEFHTEGWQLINHIDWQPPGLEPWCAWIRWPQTCRVSHGGGLLPVETGAKGAVAS